jgi:lipoprotein-releasing system permease protein
VRGALVRGILPDQERSVADLAASMKLGSLEALKPGGFGVILGADSGARSGVLPGDKVALLRRKGW